MVHQYDPSGPRSQRHWPGILASRARARTCAVGRGAVPAASVEQEKSPGHGPSASRKPCSPARSMLAWSTSARVAKRAPSGMECRTTPPGRAGAGRRMASGPDAEHRGDKRPASAIGTPNVGLSCVIQANASVARPPRRGRRNRADAQSNTHRTCPGPMVPFDARANAVRCRVPPWQLRAGVKTAPARRCRASRAGREVHSEKFFSARDRLHLGGPSGPLAGGEHRELVAAEDRGR